MPAGRPRFEPTDTERAQVKAMASFGIPQDKMVLLILRPRGKTGDMRPISKPTLARAFRPELEQGEVQAIVLVADALVKTAVDRKHKSHVQAARFFLKARAGWSERVQHEHSGELQLDLAGATADELAVLERFLVRKAIPPVANDRAA